MTSLSCLKCANISKFTSVWVWWGLWLLGWKEGCIAMCSAVVREWGPLHWGHGCNPVTDPAGHTQPFIATDNNTDTASHWSIMQSLKHWLAVEKFADQRTCHKTCCCAGVARREQPTTGKRETPRVCVKYPVYTAQSYSESNQPNIPSQAQCQHKPKLNKSRNQLKGQPLTKSLCWSGF